MKRFKIANGSLAQWKVLRSDQELRELVVEAEVSIDGSRSSRGWSARDARYRESLRCCSSNKPVYFVRPERWSRGNSRREPSLGGNISSVTSHAKKTVS